MRGGQRSAVVFVGAYPVVTETFVRDHVAALADDGWRVHVLAGELQARLGGADGTALTRLRPEGPLARCRHLAAWTPRVGRLVVTSPSTRQATYLAVSARAAILRLRPAIVHAHFGHQGILAALALDGLSLPLVTTFHGWDATVVPAAEGWSAYRRILGRSHGVAHSTFVQDRLVNNTLLQVHRVRMGVDTQLFRPVERRGSWPRQVRALIVGRLVPEKGHDVALAAMKHLADTQMPHSVHLHVVGGGAEGQRLAALADALGLHSHVRWLGPRTQEEVAAEMANSDLLLVPSIRGSNGAEEGFGRVALEGLASGLPVIVSAVGGLPEAVGDAGWVVPPGDAKTLADQVVTILGGEAPDMVAQRSRAFAERFPLDVMGQDYVALASRLADS